MKYLALGDSYTIGEQVAWEDNFPNQFVTLLKNKGIAISLDKLIATTGWTTDELQHAICSEKPSRDYDLVSLLIGVNNQYRNRSEEEYSDQFYALLCQSILFAQGDPKKVVVLSIPDWGMTPFNKERDVKSVSEAIDKFNTINKQWAAHFHCHYLDITASTRIHAHDKSYLVEDELHYSAKEYALWAGQLVEIVTKHILNLA